MKDKMSAPARLRVVLLTLDTQSAGRNLRPLLADERVSVELVLLSRTLTGRSRWGLLLHLLRRSGLRYVLWQVRRRLRASSRGPTLRELCAQLCPSVPIREVQSIHAPDGFAPVEELRADLIVCVSFPEKLAPHQFALPRLGTLNIHGSLLPRYRGVTPVLHALADGAKEHGASAHWIDASLDTGPILTQERFALDHVDDYQSAWERTADAGAKALGRALDQILEGHCEALPQRGESSYCSWPPRAVIARARRRGLRLN